jgi:heme exporter protein D
MMTIVQLYLAIGLPILAVLASLVVSLVQITGIKEDIREIRREARADKLQILSKIDFLTGKVYEMMGQK